MENIFVDEESFEKIDFTVTEFKKGEYEYCTFVQCDFTKVDLSTIRFSECEFIACNFSLTTVNETFFQDVIFIDCKLVGVNFEKCNTLSLSLNFKKSTLQDCSFYMLDLSHSTFMECNLFHLDFEQTILNKVIFNRCDLKESTFIQSDLSKADFTSAKNYQFSPSKNKLDKTKFSQPEVMGLLKEYSIIVE